MPRKPAEPGKQISVWLPRRVAAELGEVAATEGITASAVARRAILRDLSAADWRHGLTIRGVAR